MKLIAALGPASTFSEIAAQMYAAKMDSEAKIELYPTIKRVFSAIGKKCEIGILPIENMLDGYISQVLDMLLHSRLTVIDEILVPVHFSFAANGASIEDIKRIFVQFVSQGQCSDFLEQLPSNIEIITTESNGESLKRILERNAGDGAVIPSHALKSFSFPLIVNNINDYIENKTRFIVVAEQEQVYRADLSYKTSIVILEGTDRPGMLSDILAAFARRSINMVSIISRPTKESMGKYHFFIDIDGYARDKHIQDALTEVRKCGFVKLIGSFPKADQSTIFDSEDHSVKKIPQSPWKTVPDKPVVYTVKGNDPYQNTINALKNIDCSPIKGKRILLKPNLGRIGTPESGIVTNPQVIAAAIDFFRDAGASFCAVGESPITGVDVMESFSVSGIAEVCRQRNVPIIDMDVRQPTDVIVPNSVALEKISICADVFDFDILVSIPVMKMHMHTGVTLSIKNMKGCLWARSKVYLHMLPPVPYCDDRPLNVAIADMASVLYPHISIIDGTTGMEGLGPSAGAPKSLGAIVVSTDALAADSVACEIMGVSPGSIPHLRILQERGAGTIDASQIDIRPLEWRSYTDPFAPIPQNLSIEYPNVSILDENSCSACQSTLLMFLKRHGTELSEYFPDSKVTAAIGKGHKEIPANALCIGNCTRKFRDHTIYVSGCPPVASSILKAIKKHKKGE